MNQNVQLINDEFWKIKAKLHIYNKALNYYNTKLSKFKDERSDLREQLRNIRVYMFNGKLNISIMQRLFDISRMMIRKSMSERISNELNKKTLKSFISASKFNRQFYDLTSKICDNDCKFFDSIDIILSNHVNVHISHKITKISDLKYYIRIEQTKLEKIINEPENAHLSSELNNNLDSNTIASDV
jgi:hypothetical protein